MTPGIPRASNRLPRDPRSAGGDRDAIAHAVRRCRSEAAGAGGRVVHDDEHAVRRQILEQVGSAIEEQGQEIFDTAGRYPGTHVAVNRLLGQIAGEAQAVAGGGTRAPRRDSAASRARAAARSGPACPGSAACPDRSAGCCPHRDRACRCERECPSPWGRRRSASPAPRIPRARRPG